MTPAQDFALWLALMDARKSQEMLSRTDLYREADWCKVLGDRLEAVLKGEAHEVQG